MERKGMQGIFDKLTDVNVFEKYNANPLEYVTDRLKTSFVIFHQQIDGQIQKKTFKEVFLQPIAKPLCENIRPL